MEFRVVASGADVMVGSWWLLEGFKIGKLDVEGARSRRQEAEMKRVQELLDIVVDVC